MSNNHQEFSSPDIQRALFDIAKLLNASGLDLKTVVKKVLQVTLTLIDCEKCSLFLLDKSSNELYDIAFDLNVMSDGRKGEKHLTIPLGQGIAGTVAKTKIGRNINDAYSDPLFNRDIDAKTGFKTRNILCLPIFATLDQSQDNELVGVASLMNKKEDKLFDEEDIKIFKNFLLLAGTAIKNAKLYEQTQDLAKKNQELLEQARLVSKRAEILLEVAKITSRANGIESLIKNILELAKKFVHAQASSLFLIDSKRNELYSSIFESDGVEQKIRFPISTGVAGYVATSGVTANIANAYQDSRFNPEFDRKNNFKTVSMLSVPIFGPEGNIVGVTNLVNKLDEHGKIGTFSLNDQSLFEGIAVFCGLALHKTMLIEEIQNQKSRLSITMELISFHARAKPEEIDTFLERKAKYYEPKEFISSFQYDPHKFMNTDDNLVAIAHQIFTDLSFHKQYEIADAKFVDYILTVRRNYRPVAYHNFAHAVSVSHGLFVLIVNGILDEYFSKLELFSMLVACLNHDIDHRGTNNAFQQKTHSVLASFYSTSTMERHHINHCMMILNSHSGHLNILENLSNSDYKKALEIIESSILATDLALFFGNKKKITEIMMTGGFDKKNADHLALLRGSIMTCCDLSSMYKPFDNARHTANSVYEEFFQQGDEELKLGLPYTSELTNRGNAKEIPRMQIGFYNFVVIPAFETLHLLLGSPVKDLLSKCTTNLKEWEKLKDSGIPYVHNFSEETLHSSDHHK